MFDSQLTVVGNLVADPRLSTMADGSSVASFRIASTRRWFDRASGEWRDGDTLYANVTCWRGLAENVVASLKKGQSAVVLGRLSVRPYETKDGEKRQSVDIDAQVVGSDLSRAISLVKKAERATVSASGWAGPGSFGGGEAGEPGDAGEQGAGGAAHADADWRSLGAPVDAPDDDRIDDAFDDEFSAAEVGASGFADDAEPDLTSGELVGAAATNSSDASGAPGAGGRRKTRFGIG
jgi:single-strand DNA-binding protein